MTPMQAIRIMERGAEELARKNGRLMHMKPHEPMNPERFDADVTVLLAIIMCIIAALVLSSCGTNQPLGPQIAPEVHAQAASFDGSKQDSGIIGVQSGQFHVTPHFHDRYIAMASKYGSRFTPAIDTARGVQSCQDGSFLFDGEAMQDFLRMNQWLRNEIASTPAPSLLKKVTGL